jgi:hypothetical protein
LILLFIGQINIQKLYTNDVQKMSDISVELCTQEDICVVYQEDIVGVITICKNFI